VRAASWPSVAGDAVPDSAHRESRSTGSRRLDHYPRCFGCGSANARGLGLEVRWDGREARAVHTPPDDAEGAPGVVHGGYIGALADEVMALAASAGEIPAMTRRIEVDYRAPALTGQPLDLRATVEPGAKRAVIARLSARPTEADHLVFEATGVYVKLPSELWLRQMAPRDPVSGDVELKGASASTYFRVLSRLVENLYDGTALGQPITVALHLRDVDPPDWCVRATADALTVEEGDCAASSDAEFTGDVQSWQHALREPAVLPELVAAGSARVGGDSDLLAALLGALPVQV
jgi:acyl-coenzyme A thioesterase PaaI-like protein